MVTSNDEGNEGGGVIEVCAELSSTSNTRVLECNLSATFMLSNGSKAGILYNYMT